MITTISQKLVANCLAPGTRIYRNVYQQEWRKRNPEKARLIQNKYEIYGRNRNDKSN